MSNTRKSTTALVGLNIVAKIFVLVSSVFLARILFPEDYGYMAVAMIFDGFFNLFTITGFETYYVQKRNLDADDDTLLLGKVYWLRIRQSIILFLIQLILGIALYFFKDAILGKMIAILSLGHLLSLVGKPEETYLTKRLNLSKVAFGNLLQDISASIAKIIFALLGFGPLSFVIGQIIGIIPRIIILKSSVKLHVVIVRHGEDLKEIFNFGRAVFLNTVGAFLTSQADSAIMASFYPKTQLGIYQFARKQSILIFNFLLAPLSSFILSYIANLKNEPITLNKKFDALGVLIGLFISPFFIFLIFNAHGLIEFVFGAKWLESVVVTQVFLCYYLFQFICYPTGYILTAVGKPQIKTKISWVFSVVIVLVMLFLAHNNVALWMYCLAFSIIYSIKDIIVGIYSYRELGGYTFIDFLKTRFSQFWFILFISINLAIFHHFTSNFVFNLFYFLLISFISLIFYNRIVKSQKLLFSLQELGLTNILPIFKRLKLV
jgi:O-antigen/teichoic acid export membrane protein